MLPRNPVSITAIPRHMLLWVWSDSHDIFIPNPNFNSNTENKTSIYCVHGTADRSASFSMIAERMKEKLPDNIDGFYLVTFEGRMLGKSVVEFASQLGDKIAKNDSKHVILMGHSRGSLVCSYFAEYLAAKKDVEVDLVACICGPFRGSALAMWPLTVFSTSVAEMQLDSPYLQELSTRIQQSSTNYLFVGAENDQLVRGDSYLPYHQEQRTGLNVLYLDRHGHLSIMSSHRLVDVLADLINQKEHVHQNRNDNPPSPRL